MHESVKLLKRFAMSSLLLLCVAGTLCGAALVESNTRYLALGERGRQVSFAMDRETETLADPADPFAAALYWARCAPAPAGTLLMLGESLLSLASATK